MRELPYDNSRMGTFYTNADFWGFDDSLRAVVISNLHDIAGLYLELEEYNLNEQLSKPPHEDDPEDELTINYYKSIMWKYNRIRMLQNIQALAGFLVYKTVDIEKIPFVKEELSFFLGQSHEFPTLIHTWLDNTLKDLRGEFGLHKDVPGVPENIHDFVNAAENYTLFNRGFSNVRPHLEAVILGKYLEVE